MGVVKAKVTVHVFKNLFKNEWIAQIRFGDFGVFDVAGPACDIFVNSLPFGEFFFVSLPEVCSSFFLLVFLGSNSGEANLGKAAQEERLS